VIGQQTFILPHPLALTSRQNQAFYVRVWIHQILFEIDFAMQCPG
jgi:hypothetical protein